MISCPHCSEPQDLDEQNFGTLCTCPKCEAVFFLGWNGQPEVSSLILPESSATSDVALGHSEFPSLQNNDLQVNHPHGENLGDLEGTPDFLQEELQESIENQGAPDAGLQIIEEIEKYANNDLAPTSLMTIDLHLEGIDSGIQVQQVKDILSDSRFGWDPLEIMKGLKYGTLSLPNLSPFAAIILVKRLKAISIDVTWRQHVH